MEKAAAIHDHGDHVCLSCQKEEEKKKMRLQ